MRREQVHPEVHFDSPDEPARARLLTWPAMIAAATLALTARALLGPLQMRQYQTIGAGIVLVVGGASPPGRWLIRRLAPGRARRLALVGCVGGLLAGWAAGYFLQTVVGVCLAILLGASRGPLAAWAQRNKTVNPDPPAGPSLRERWSTAAARTDLVHRLGESAGEPVQAAGEAEPNGVGGDMLRVPLPYGLTPDDVARRAYYLRAWMHVPWVFVRARDGRVDEAEVHCYDHRPLTAEPIGWRALEVHSRGGVQRIPYALDVYGSALHLDMRQCTCLVGLTRAGKTGVQFAMVAGSALAGVPLHLHLADVRSGGDSELRALKEVAESYAQTTDDVWSQVHRLELEIRQRRAAGVSADGVTYQPTATWPLVHLAFTEGMALLTSRPPAHPPEGHTWTTYTGARHDSKPGVDEWRLMFAEAMGGIAREGASVGVSFSGGFQAAQLDSTKEMKFVRRYIPQNILLRVRTGSDVDPALGDGALAGGAAAHELPPDVPGLLYARPDGVHVHYGRAAWVSPAEITEVAALLHAAELDRMRSANRRDPA